MFRIPFSLLTDTIILQPATMTGLGVVLDEDDPVTVACLVRREAKWSGTNEGALIQDIVRIVSNTPIPVGSVVELSDGEVVEVKSLETAKVGRIQSGWQMVAW